MPSQHDPEEAVIAVRGPRRDRDAVGVVLTNHGWDMRAAVLALIGWLKTDPTAALAALAPYRPVPKPPAGRGRPRRPERTGDS